MTSQRSLSWFLPLAQRRWREDLDDGMLPIDDFDEEMPGDGRQWLSQFHDSQSLIIITIWLWLT
jgi:hypothetical protein